MPGRIDQPRVQAAARLAGQLSDPVRIAIVDILAEGARIASQLADELAVTTPRLANHLTRLRAAGIVAVTRSGRHAIYRLADPRITDALSAMRGIGPGDEPISAAPPAINPMAEARTCYDHLAGRVGVAVFDYLVDAGALLVPPDSGHSAITIGPGAAAGFAALGVDADAPLPRRRRPATTCLDWTERRPHLGGALGAAVLDSALASGWARKAGGRTLTITATGRGHLPPIRWRRGYQPNRPFT